MIQMSTTQIEETDGDVNNSASIVARAGQVMGVIIFFGLLSMISSMLVSDSLSGDAAQINNAGALRMQALKVSRAKLIRTNGEQPLSQAIEEFDERLTRVFFGGFANPEELTLVQQQFSEVESLWLVFKSNPENWDYADFDVFVNTIDELVTLLQKESEKTLASLRMIQGFSLLAVLLVSAVVLFRLNKVVVTPLKQIVEVAHQAGRGNFEIKVDYQSENELGVLAQTINQMSAQLKQTYRDFEERVAHSTAELIQSNRSLELLFDAARKLSSNQHYGYDRKIVEDIEPMLGNGKLAIERVNLSRNSMIVSTIPFDTIEPLCLERYEYPLEKQTQRFGQLVWQLPKDQKPQEWQNQLLQAMADLIATSIQLEQKRNTEDRLLIVEERAVIARELHDSLAQSLSYLKVQLSLLTRKIQKDLEQEQIIDTIDDIKEGLNKAYAQLRELLTTFRLKLDDPSIENALQGTVAEFTAKCHHPVILDFQLPSNYLSANQEIHVLQIVREALSNVQRHAKASRAGVSISLQNKQVSVTVWDDGVGINLSNVEQDHFGLGIMEERAKSLNALIDINNRLPQGTCIKVQFELAATH